MTPASDAPRPRSTLSHSFNFIAPLLATREANAIAKPEFYLFAERYPIQTMKTISEIRHDNLLELIKKHGSIAALNVAIGMTRTDATLSQIKNKSPDSKTGVPKAMGTPVARRIENELNLEVGWMDNAHPKPNESTNYMVPLERDAIAGTPLVLHNGGAARPTINASDTEWPFELFTQTDFMLLSEKERHAFEDSMAGSIQRAKKTKRSA